MRKLIFVLLVNLMWLSIYAQDDYVFNSKGSLVTIRGTSSFHDWESSSSEGVIEISSLIVDKEVKRLSSVNFSIKGNTMKSKSKKLDKQMYKAFDVKNYPVITFVLTDVISLNNNNKVEINGDLTIKGITKNIVVKGNIAFEKNGKTMLIVLGTKQINIKDFNIKPPQFLFGMFKISNLVTIEFHINFINKNINKN